MKGSYILLIEVKKNLKLSIGSLGEITFPKGIYAYVGSAMNSLEARIKRHLRKDKKLFWHIDYLLNNKNVKVIKVFYKESKKKEECKIAKIVSRYGEPIKGFGCSDCKCSAHLFKLRGEIHPTNFGLLESNFGKGKGLNG